jgi:hypothetical protein
VPVLAGDDEHTLAARVFEEEKIAFARGDPRALHRLRARAHEAGVRCEC